MEQNTRLFLFRLQVDTLQTRYFWPCRIGFLQLLHSRQIDSLIPRDSS